MEDDNGCSKSKGLMKFTIDFQHREFFIRNHAIEFEQLIPAAQLEIFQGHLHEFLIERQEKNHSKQSSYSPEDLFMAVHDLWRGDDFLRKTVTNKTFAEIAAELSEKKPLRLAFDQYFPRVIYPLSVKEKNDYASLLSLKSTLVNFSPVQGVVCGLMLCLSNDAELEEELTPESSEFSLFSRIPGNGVYFDQNAILNFEEWSSAGHRDYLMIVYAQERAVYIRQPDNPHAHALKNVGYVYGDRLKDKLNPILIR